MVDLLRLKILIVDCQATGAGPGNAHLLEMGWAYARASDAPGDLMAPARISIARLPTGESIPPRVQKITGLSDADLENAEEPESIWRHLVRSSASTKDRDRPPCPAVIHYARYEEPFLRALHEKFELVPAFPLQVICSHRIAQKLFPRLPRRGIRALAGYFGHSVSEYRRCAHHITATAVIWHHLVKHLKKRFHVTTLPELMQWLEEGTASRRRERIYPMPSETRKGLPDQPGVYQMLRSNGDVLYVGKATSLKQRVASYFHKGRRHAEHLLEMLSQAVDLEVTVTDTALEAAVLETDRIKRLSPPYNIALRSRDRFPAFATKDFSSLSRKPDAVHSVGPLPGMVPHHPLSAISRLVLSGMSTLPEEIEKLCRASLNVAPPYVPGPECFVEGFNLFHQRNHAVLSDVAPLKLLHLGARLWRERLEAREEKAASAIEGTRSETEDGKSDKDFEWTAEKVAGALESSIRHSAHMVRRGRFFCFLSDSVLAWDPRRPGSDEMRYLVIHKGEIQHRGHIPKTDSLPMPPVEKGGWPSRLFYFDLPAYDRMRVITTEVRRLISEGRDVRLRFNASVCLGTAKLRKLLRWV